MSKGSVLLALIALLTSTVVDQSSANVGPAKPSAAMTKNAASFSKQYSFTKPYTKQSLFTPVTLPRSLESRSMTTSAQLWSNAWKKLNDNDYAAAIPILSQLIDTNDNLWLAYSLRAKCWLAAQQFGKAKADAKNAIAQDGRQSLPWIITGYCQMGENDPPSAITSFTEAIKIEPANAEALLNRGICYFYSNDMQKTVDDETAAISAEPKAFEAYFYRAQANMNLGNWNGVKDDGQVMVKLDRNSGEGHAIFGYGLEGTGSGYEAVPQYHFASVCFKDLGLFDQMTAMNQELARVIPQYDYGKSRYVVNR